MSEPNSPDSPATSTLQERVQSLRLGREVRVPPRRSSMLFWILVLGLLAAIGIWVYQSYGAQWAGVFSSAPSSTTSATAANANGSPGHADKEKSTANIALEAGGYIVPVQKVQVSPKVGGQVMALFIEEGTFVEKGQKLAELERDEYLFEYNRTKALAELAKAKFDEAEHGNRDEEKWQADAAEKEASESLKLAQDELTKVKASGYASSFDERDKAESRYKIALQKLEQQKALNKLMKLGTRAERLEAARSEYQQACSERDKAKWKLDSCDVVAPISGVILEKKTELGNTVRPEAFSNGLSASVCDMADLRNLEVEVDISERDIRRIKRGQKCLIRTEAFTDKKYDGQVARIMPVASRSKASVTVRVKINVPSDEKDLRPEMRARVQFLKEGEADSVATSPATVGMKK
jgi:HlyD family secretion protein